jgi:hypothetical protein
VDCSVCGMEPENVYEMGHAAPVATLSCGCSEVSHQVRLQTVGGSNRVTAWIAQCDCGWVSDRRRSMTLAKVAGVAHLDDLTPRTVRCDGCSDIIPTRMTTTTPTGVLCPECYNRVEPVPSAVIVDDLRALEQELRPAGWDGK